MATRITTGMVQRSVLADLNRVTARLTRTQEQAASNRAISRPSDDPAATTRALKLRESLAGTQQFQRNVQDAQGWQDAAESAMGTITDVVHRARELLVQGASDTSDPVSRQAIAKEIDALVGSVKEAANANYGGRYIFGGTRTDQPPYQDGAADAFAGSATQVARQIGPGVSLDVSLDVASVLGSGQGAGDGKLLDTLRDIADHMRSGDSAAMRASDLPGLDRNLDSLLGLRALNGARTNRLDAAMTRLEQVEEATVTQLSETEDVDIARVLIDLNSQQAAYQAALKAGANIFQSSLMDFLR